MYNIEQASAVHEGTELISALSFMVQHHTPTLCNSCKLKNKKIVTLRQQYKHLHLKSLED